MRKLITAADLRQLAGEGNQVTVPAGSVLTPSALDMAKEQGIALLWEQGERKAAAKPAGKPVCAPTDAGRAAETSPDTVPAADIPVIVRKVLDQVLRPACADPRVTLVKGGTVTLEPFDQAPPGQDIRLKDVITAREANLCAGFMAFDHSRLPWHLTYDEVDYVAEGTFTVQAAGHTYTLAAGDVLYIPKGTKVVFASPDKARVFYVTYPANWADLNA